MNIVRPSTQDLKQDHSELVKSFSAGDPGAFEKLFNIFSVPLLDFANTYVKEKQASEDIVQDVFVTIWRKRENLNPALSIKSYLYKAVMNQALKHLRRAKLERESEETIVSLKDEIETPLEELDKKEVVKSVNEAIEKLPEKCREIFTMNRFDGLSYAEIAEVQDISINTVKTQMGRALKYLRKYLSSFAVLFTG